MPIEENQLRTWTALGSVVQSRDTYNSIKNVLEDLRSPYALVTKQFDTFLQGSYGNDTNVHGDSDVDIVIRQKSLFYYNLDALSVPEKAEFRHVFHSPAQYDLPAFKMDVIAWLAENYGADFDPNGNKAVYIREWGNRRNADVLIAAEHRRFTAFPNAQNPQFAEGVIFFPLAGGSIINYPKQHSANLTAKHQATNEWLKPVIRVFKNMRNWMIRDAALNEGVAPSYFVEGLLYNVPRESFGGSLQATVGRCLDFAEYADQTRLVCANYQHWLVRDNEKTSWPSANFATFVRTARQFWNDW